MSSALGEGDLVLNQAMEEWEKSSEDPKICEVYLTKLNEVLYEF